MMLLSQWTRPLHALVICSALALWAAPGQAEESRFLTEARAAAKAAPRDAAVQVALGEALLEARLLQEAQKVFTQASRLPEGRVSGTSGLARIKMVQDNIPAARQICSRVAALAKGQPAGPLCEGYASLAWKRSSRAIGSFEQALKMEPTNVDALIGMGEVHRAQMDTKAAEDSFRKALAVEPGSAKAHLGLGLVYLGVDRMSDAQRELRAAAKSAPGLAEPHYHLGNLLGDNAEGIAELRKAVEIRPSWGQGQEALGQALSRSGQHQEAIPVLKRAIAAQDTLAGAHQYLGLSQAALKQYPQAEQALRAAIKLVPSLSAAVLELGDVQAAQGRHDEALQTYEQARDLSPHDAQVAMHTGKLYRTLSRNTPARAQFARAKQLDPNLAAAEVALGDIAFEQEDWEEARRHYDAATRCSNKVGVDPQHLRTRLEQLRRQ